MTRRLLPLTLLAVFAVACDDAATSPETVAAPDVASEAMFKKNNTPVQVGSDVEAALSALARDVEADVVARMPNVRLAELHWFGNPAEEQMGGNLVFFEDRGNKQIPIQWVPRDPRRNGRTDIRWAVEPSAPPGLTVGEVLGAVTEAMNTWQGTTPCSNLTLTQVSSAEVDFDIWHAGFVPFLPPGVLGATNVFIWVDGDGVPTDIDGDGNFDYAFALIFYGEVGPWGIDTNTFPFVDVETVVFHEMGHGLGQAHFGKVFGTFANGKVHFAPRAVMNAGYSGLQQSLTGTDRAGHCSIWGSWPNN